MTSPKLERSSIRVESIGGTTVTRQVAAPGWRWSVNAKPIVKTDWCRAAHQVCVFSGQFHVQLEDGTEFDLYPGDVAAVPPGHDSWVVGDVPCETADFSSDYVHLIAAGDALDALMSPQTGPRLSRSEAARRLRVESDGGRLDPHAVELVLGAIGHSRRQGPAGLTPRQIEVLVLIATGASAKQVAMMLTIQEKTARNHIERIYAKCDLSSRSDATRFAIAHGLVEPLPTAAHHA